jgi:hypothetical protein
MESCRSQNRICRAHSLSVRGWIVLVPRAISNALIGYSRTATDNALRVRRAWAALRLPLRSPIEYGDMVGHC